jgi:hypothetical protein
MVRDVHPEEFRAVTALPAPERYEYFVKRVVAVDHVCSLRSAEGWIMAADDSGNELFPVWSDAVYAESCREGGWSDAEPSCIPLEEWMSSWLPGLMSDGRRAAVFPVRGGTRGMAVDPATLLEDLRAELDRY